MLGFQPNDAGDPHALRMAIASSAFQRMFEKNILTFNRGRDSNAQKLSAFTDLRDLQWQLKAQDITFQTNADEVSKGTASFIVNDPDRNTILVDQHV